jgi:hypothetical protein
MPIDDELYSPTDRHGSPTIHQQMLLLLQRSIE